MYSDDPYHSDGDGDGAATEWEEAAFGNENAATGRHKPYKILKEDDIKHLLETDISTVSGVLSVPRGLACSLLCQNNWCPASVYDKWFAAADDDGEKNPNPAVIPPPEQEESTKQRCSICYRNIRPKRMASAACGHPFCSRCWKTYIATAVSDGAACLTLRCPEPGCGAAATVDMVEKLASKSVINKYNQYLRRSYVELSRRKKWCPAAGCDFAVEFEGGGGGSEGYDVFCDCTHEFCWNCTEERHRLVDCKSVAAWSEKNKSEAENTTWILAFTKPCPKCGRPIEKNDGCNHMTCKSPCRFQFCWMCGEPWKKHDGGFYSCNRYKEERERGVQKDDDKMKREMTKRYLERYSHYYERWVSNDKSRKIAMGNLKRARERCWAGKMQFVVETWEQIVECRRVLKWSYVYGYYLEEGPKTALFEHLQGQAEGELERLHHYVEKEIKDEDVYLDCDYFNRFRKELVDLTKVTSNYFQNLVVALENDLVEVDQCIAATNSETKRKRKDGSSLETKKKKKISKRISI